MKIKKILPVRSLLFLMAYMCCTSMFAQQPPNIVLVMADDLGWADVGYNGAKFYETPHIDQLAKDGMIFNRFYQAAANCAPSRASLLSGMYTPRHQIYIPQGLSRGDVNKMRLVTPTQGEGENFNTFPVSINQLAPNVQSLAELLKDKGYASARIGKWHVGDDNQGFDLSSAEGTPGYVTNKDGVEKRFYADTHVAENMTNLGLAFIEDHQDRPFFLYLAHWEVHTPLSAQEERIAYFEQKKKNFPQQNYDATYAAEIEQVDISVGRLREKLQELDLHENTLFIFTSDNGGLSRITSNAPLRAGKGTYYEGGIRVPMCMTWPVQVKSGQRNETPTIGVDIFPTLAEVAGAKPYRWQTLDGTSLMPLLKGDALHARTLFWHFPLYLSGKESACLPVFGTNLIHWRAVPSSVMMQGKWKLIYYYEYGRFELFNLDEDIGEKLDLSTDNPEQAKSMLDSLKQWVHLVNAPVPHKLNSKFAY